MSKIPQGLLQFFIVAILLLVVFFSGSKKTKQQVAEHYNISRPTLAKWIKYFQGYLSYEEWNKKRSLNSFEFVTLTTSFGTNSSMALSKKQIVALSESNYKVVAENVKKNLTKIGISEEAWESCSVFPPSVSAKILEVLG